jgi:hypothetical protein
MSNKRKPLQLLLLLSVLLLGLPAWADDTQGHQISLSLDGTLQGISFFTYPSGNTPQQLGLGGSAFVDLRLIRVLSLGLGVDYVAGANSNYTIGTFDCAGRIFPLILDSGEVYLQGGVGYNLDRGYVPPGHFHGYAGMGYRHFLTESVALDMGAQYDFYSPIAAHSDGFGAKFGITFLFGRLRYPATAVGSKLRGEVEGADEPVTYVWKVGDNLKKIAAKFLGGAELFPYLVDKNPGLFSQYQAIKPGTKILIPPMHLTDDQMDQIQTEAFSAKYLAIAKESRKLVYAKLEGWKGPKSYTWKSGDDMKSVASKLYDDEDLYPILVDANENHLIHPVNLVPGVVIVVPVPPSDDFREAIHELGWDRSYYQWWRNVSEGD